MKNGFLKVCTLSPALRVADCAYNTQETIYPGLFTHPAFFAA